MTPIIHSSPISCRSIPFRNSITAMTAGMLPDVSVPANSSAPCVLRTSKDWFVWINAIRTLHPRAWPYVDPDVESTQPHPEPGAKPRPTDIKTSEAAALTGPPMSTASTVAEDWDGELAAFRSLSDSEREYYFEKVRQWEANERQKHEFQEAIAAVARDVLASVGQEMAYLILQASPSQGRGGGAKELHNGMKRLAKRYKPTVAEVERWILDLPKPDDESWREWLDMYLSIYWMERCLGSEEAKGDVPVKMFLKRVEHLTATWASTWKSKMEIDHSNDTGRKLSLPGVMDLAEDWRQWMEFRGEHSRVYAEKEQ